MNATLLFMNYSFKYDLLYIYIKLNTDIMTILSPKNLIVNLG